MPRPNYNFRWFRDGTDDSEIPAELGRVDTSQGPLQLRAPLILEPQHDPEANRQWMSAEYPPLGLLVTAPTRSTLVDALREEIAFLWEEYIVDKDARLSPGAMTLRMALMDHFEVVSDAAR